MVFRDFAVPLLPFLRRDQRQPLKRVSCPHEGISEEFRWEYDMSENITSIVNQWDLVCERTALKSTVQSSYMFGVFVGCIVFGWASDRSGTGSCRKHFNKNDNPTRHVVVYPTPPWV